VDDSLWHSCFIYSITAFLLTAQSGEESILVASLRGVIAKQAAEIETLQTKLKELTASVAAAETAASDISQSTAKFAEVCLVLFVAALTLSYCEQERASLEAALEAERTKRTDVEKEQEDLLVLLDELSNKRTKDKQRMKEQGMEVSEDEDDEEEDGEEEEED
jgi:hypothetical protein